MQARRQFDIGVDAARNDAALKRAEPSRPGRLPSRTAHSLTAVLLVTFAAIFLPLQAEAQTGICGRTEAVRTAILDEIPGITACGNVTDAHLAAITGTLRLRNKGISALAAGDFDGLTELTALDLAHNNLSTLSAGVFDELTALEILLLHSNSLTTLPAGVFDELTELSVLDLASNSLSALSAGVFEELTELTALYLNTNSLTTLPAGVFDELTELTDLYLRKNSLSTFPDDVFEELTALTNLQLQDNPGAPFSPTADALPDAGTVPVAGGNVTLDGSGSGGPWGTNVTYSWRQTSGPTSGVTFDDAASATPVVTIPVLTASTELTFTLTVTGRATDTSRGAAPGADTATVTAPAANASPSFTSPATFSAAENQTAVGTVAASDSDTDDSVTGYAIHGGADRSKFSIVEATGTLTFASAPNFEEPADADTDNDYVVAVRATSGAGERVKTAEVTITVTVTDVGGEAPGVPAAPSVSSASASSVTVTWTAPTNAGPAIGDYDYRYRVTSPQGSWTEVTTTTITQLSVTITQLEENADYDVQVRATNDEGTSGWSASGTGVTEAGANAAPSFTSPATFSAAENQTAVGTVQASDSDVGDSVTGYAIQGGADASKFSIVASTGVLTFASAPNFEAPADADADNDYVVVVRATSGAGTRVKTAEVTITVTVTDVGGEAPGVPAAPSVSSASASSVTVTWTAPANAGPVIGDYDYRYRVTSPQGSWTEVTTTTITQLSVTITQLEENADYDVQVRATNDEGTSGWSASGTGTTEAGAIANAPENLQATAGNAQVTLRWDAPGDDGGADITGYAYRHKESGGDFIAYMDIPDSGPGEANTRSYTVTGLTNGQEYVFQVRAENEHGGGSPAEVTVMLPSRVSTESEELPTEAVLMGNYPNPFNPETTIRYALPQTGNVHLAVYDLLGHEVAVLVDEPKPAGHHATRFDAGDLPSGAYIYRLQAQDKIMVQIMILVK